MRSDWPRIWDYRGKHVHMIGIGGSSMSGLAAMLQQQGFAITGSDNLETYATRHVRDELGIPVCIGHHAENVHGADLVVFSAAIAEDNAERAECFRLGIPQLERGPLLGQLMEGYAPAVAVCGTHGKTTTTSMLAQVMMDCGADPTIHIGGNLDYIGGNTRIGQGGGFLTEACEYRGSFLYMHPTAAVLMNIDEDHLDYYRDIDHIQQTFGEFLSLLPADGLCAGNADDERVRCELHKLPCRTLLFGSGEYAEARAEDLTFDDCARASFTFSVHGKPLGNVQLQVPGEFQVTDALAALSMAYLLRLDMPAACKALGGFRGAHRRFELTSVIDGVKLYHDYGHNPTEMRSAVSVAVRQPHNRVWAVMQPHTFSRVKALFNDYLTCTEAADITLVTDIYAAREKDPGDIRTEMLIDGMHAHGVNAVHTPSFDDTEAYLRAHWQPGDLVLTMGCGNINQLNEQMERHEQEKREKTKG